MSLEGIGHCWKNKQVPLSGSFRDAGVPFSPKHFQVFSFVLCFRGKETVE